MKHAGLLILVWALGMTAFADDFKLYYDSNASSATQVEMVDNLKKLTFEKGKMTVVRKDGTNTEVDLTNVKRLFFSTDATAIEEVKDAMAGMLSPEVKEEVTGTAEVLQTYKISRVGTIAGCMVREGKIKRTSKVRLIRDGIVIYTGELGSLKRFKDDVKEVSSGYDCGLNIANYNDIKEGDMVEAYEEVEVSKTL